MIAPKILLLQVRKDKQVLDSELHAFSTYAGLPIESFTPLRVFETPDFDPTLVTQYDALMIGGSSDDPQTPEWPMSEYPFMENVFGLMQYAIDKKIPTLASCQGFHFAIQLLGERVVGDDTQKEMEGTATISLTDEAKDDELFGGLPPSFSAISVHKKSAQKLPNGCTRLAYSERTHIHAFKVEKAPFRATQFHAELSTVQVEEWLYDFEYRKRYYPTLDEARAYVAEMDETPIANGLIKKFVEVCL